MRARKVAWIFLRCAGLVLMIVGIARLITIIPVMQQMTWATGTGGFFAKMFLPSGAEFVAGLVTFLLAKPLSRAVVPAADNDGVA